VAGFSLCILHASVFSIHSSFAATGFSKWILKEERITVKYQKRDRFGNQLLSIAFKPICQKRKFILFVSIAKSGPWYICAQGMFGIGMDIFPNMEYTCSCKGFYSQAALRQASLIGENTDSRSYDESCG